MNPTPKTVSSLFTQIVSQMPREDALQAIRDVLKQMEIGAVQFIIPPANANEFTDRNYPEWIKTHLTYSVLVDFMVKSSGEVCFTNGALLRAWCILGNIWDKATGGESRSTQDGHVVWIEDGADWMYPNHSKQEVFLDLMLLGPLYFKISLTDPNLLRRGYKEASFWDIVFDQATYEKYFTRWH